MLIVMRGCSASSLLTIDKEPSGVYAEKFSLFTLLGLVFIHAVLRSIRRVIPCTDRRIPVDGKSLELDREQLV